MLLQYYHSAISKPHILIPLFFQGGSMIVIIAIYTLIASRCNLLHRASAALSGTNIVEETQLIEP
jgi:hypothetical protein